LGLVWRETGAVRNARPSRGQAASTRTEAKWNKIAKPTRSFGLYWEQNKWSVVAGVTRIGRENCRSAVSSGSGQARLQENFDPNSSHARRIEESDRGILDNYIDRGQNFESFREAPHLDALVNAPNLELAEEILPIFIYVV
jgi:hypothetical protein